MKSIHEVNAKSKWFETNFLDLLFRLYFKRIKKKHGQNALNVVRKLENVKTKIIKLQTLNL